MANFDLYPSKRIWGLSRTDKNIDHRRVPNLQTFFKRHGEVLNISNTPKDYKITGHYRYVPEKYKTHPQS